MGGLLHVLTDLRLAHWKVGEVWLLLGHRIEVKLMQLLFNKLLLVGLGLQVALVLLIEAGQPCIVLFCELELRLLGVKLLLVLADLADSLQMLSCGWLSVVLRHHKILRMGRSQLGMFSFRVHGRQGGLLMTGRLVKCG